jgi:hypothetical protein
MPIASRVPSFDRSWQPHRADLRQRAVALALGCVFATSAAALDFQFIYSDPAGTGFLDPVLGPDRRRALADGADVWGRLIMSSHAGEAVVVQVSFADYAAGSTTLASTKPNYFYSEFYYPKALADHLNRGDLSTRHDINMKFNRAMDFYYGNAMPGSPQTDFISLAAHELGHGLGLYSSFRQNGDYGIYGEGTFFPTMLPEMLPTTYDRFVTRGPGGLRILELGSDARAAAMTSGNLFWNGVNATAGNGGSDEHGVRF